MQRLSGGISYRTSEPNNKAGCYLSIYNLSWGPIRSLNTELALQNPKTTADIEEQLGLVLAALRDSEGIPQNPEQIALLKGKSKHLLVWKQVVTKIADQLHVSDESKCNVAQNPFLLH